MVNLDYYCMKYGQKIGLEEKNKETDIRKALGILQEDGIYAMFLWLEVKNKKDNKTRNNGLIPLYNENTIKSYLLSDNEYFPPDFNEFTKKLVKTLGNYNKLIFMKNLTMRTLTYALYHAKIRAGDENVEKV